MDYKNRRENLLNLMDDNSVFVLFNKAKHEDASIYECERNFYYLTGILEFDDVLLLKKGKENLERIYIQKIDPVREKWTGKVLRKEEVTNLSSLTDIKYQEEFFNDFLSLIDYDTKVYTIHNENGFKDVSYEELFRNQVLDKKLVTMVNGNNLLKKLRTIKDSEEIEMIKKANHITNEGLKAILKNLKPGLYEYQLESYFDQAIKFNGGTGFSFPTICAGGINATCLHYSSNNQILNDGDLVLLDLGSSLNTYCADISRTFPVNGKFTDRQKMVYEIVLNGQKYIESIAKPGFTTRELNAKLVDYFYEELTKIGLIKTKEEVSKYYFHGVSHHLGMDCHDFCVYEALVPGAVISNEPGLYIPEWNIGIRIEDDLLITEDGCVNLSKDIIKEVKDIEEFMAK